MDITKPKWICLNDEQPDWMATAVLARIDYEGAVQQIWTGFFVPGLFGDPSLRFCPNDATGRAIDNESSPIPQTYVIPKEGWPYLYYFTFRCDHLDEMLGIEDEEEDEDE